MTDPVRPVFLLSLPRSGSTMTQSVLATHPQVATASEPWVLLPLVATWHEELADAPYDHRWACRAIGSFARDLPDGPAGYRRRVRELTLSLYADASPEGARWFVDKTPRYHLIVDDLIELFPDAVFVFLWRNPLAVVASMMDWYRVGWVPYRHGVDLFDGLERLVAASERLEDAPNAVSVNYEQLVSGTSAWERLFGALGLDFDPTALERLHEAAPGGPIGDPLRNYDRVSDASVDKWREALDSPVRAAWAARYLDWIGAERLARMGYDRTRLDADLAAVGGGGWRAAAPDVLDAARQRAFAWRRGRSGGTWFPRARGGA